MNFKVVFNDYGPGYVIEKEDGTYTLVNLELEKIVNGDLDLLLQFGMWKDVTEPVSEDIYAEIKRVFEKGDVFEG